MSEKKIVEETLIRISGIELESSIKPTRIDKARFKTDIGDITWKPTKKETTVLEADVFGSQNTGVNVTNNYVWSNVDHFSNFTTKGSYIPIIETETLLDILINMNIEPGIKNSLKAKLINTLYYLNTAQNHFLMGSLNLGNENLTLAINKINAFQNEVEAQKGKSISNEDVDRLLTDAEEIIFLINNAIV